MTDGDDTARQGWRSWVVLAAFLGGVFALSAVGGFITAKSVGAWYHSLARPSFNPPDWIFAPVWTVLYITIAVAGWLVWRRSGFGRARDAFVIYALQLACNLTWTVLFFGLHAIGGALIEIVILLAVIVLNAYAFYRIIPVAGLLYVPYALWVGFATILNASFWWLN